MELALRKDAAGAPPVYRQIAAELEQRIREGELRPGERLLPIRELARRLGVNRDTVALAYEALAAQGLVDARVGRGTFVRARGPAAQGSAGERSAVFSRATEGLLDFERARTVYGAGEGTIALHALVPDPARFPVESFRRSVSRSFAAFGAELLVYGGPQGHPALREVWAERLQAAGARVGPESIVLCHGASQGIAMALRLFADAGERVAMEEPTYPNALAAAIGLGIGTLAVPMGPEGCDLEALDRALARPDVKAFYTIPTFHNPTGLTTSQAHRRELLAIAARHGKPVIEDGYEMDLRFRGRPVPSLLALDEGRTVVQLGSFSKSLFPGLRCGAVVARGRAVEALLALKHATDLGGAPPLQVALADFVRTGAYDRHLAQLRRHLRRQCDALLDTLAQEMPEGVRFTRPEGGYQTWLELPEGLDSRELFADALRAGVLFAPGHQFHHDGRSSSGLRLTFGRADEPSLRRGAEILARLVRQRLAAEGHGRREASVHV